VSAKYTAHNSRRHRAKRGAIVKSSFVNASIRKRMQSPSGDTGDKKRTRNVRYRRSETSPVQTMRSFSKPPVVVKNPPMHKSQFGFALLCQIATDNTVAEGATDLRVVGRGEDLSVAGLASVVPALGRALTAVG